MSLNKQTVKAEVESLKKGVKKRTDQSQIIVSKEATQKKMCDFIYMKSDKADHRDRK